MTRPYPRLSLTLGIGIGLGFLVSGGDVFEAVVVGTALTSTALGTVLPMLRDRGELKGRFGTVVSAFGAVGEFGPVVAMALLLSGRRPAESAVLLAAFGVVTAAAVFCGLRPHPPWFGELTERTLHSSGQFAVRLVMLLLACMLGLAEVFGIDVLLGAFAAGVLTPAVAPGRPGGRRGGARQGGGHGLRLPRAGRVFTPAMAQLSRAACSLSLIVAPLMTLILGCALALVLAHRGQVIHSVLLVLGGALAVVGLRPQRLAVACRPSTCRRRWQGAGRPAPVRRRARPGRRRPPDAWP